MTTDTITREITPEMTDKSIDRTPDNESSDGMPLVDAMLVNFDHLASSGQIKVIENAIADETLSASDLAKKIPREVFFLIMLLVDEEGDEMPGADLLRTRVTAENRHLVEKAQQVVESSLVRLKDHPAFSELLAYYTDKEIESRGENDSVISQVSSELSWVGSPPGLVPKVTVRFSNAGNKELLRSALDSDDLMFVIWSLTRLLAQQLEQSATIVKQSNSEMIRISMRGRIKQRIPEVATHLEHIRELLSLFDVPTQAPPEALSKASDNAAAPSKPRKRRIAVPAE